jgi:hypothetical protein
MARGQSPTSRVLSAGRPGTADWHAGVIANNTSPDLPAPDASDGLIAAVEAAGLTATDDYSVANELRLRLEVRRASR